MTDAYHYIGSDLLLDDTGALVLADGTLEGEQRVLRRLLTPLQNYLWHLEYGAGLPAKIGANYNEAELVGLIREQMFMEPVVSRSPDPSINFVQLNDQGAYQINISYVDAVTGQTVVLTYPS